MGVMSIDRRPDSVDEALAMIDYNERIIATSASAQRRDRAARMLANVRPLLDQLQRVEAERIAIVTPVAPPREDAEFETVWNGGEGLTSHRGGSSLLGCGDINL